MPVAEGQVCVEVTYSVWATSHRCHVMRRIS